MDHILKAILGFYFSAIDGFFGSPDSLEGVLVITIFAIILTMVTVAVPLTILGGVALYHLGPVLAEVLWRTERGIKAIRSVAPLWAWVVIGFVMYHIGMLFGTVAHPQYATIIGGIYAIVFATMMLGGIWVAKQERKKAERLVPVFLAIVILAICLSVPLFSWAVAPGIGIVVAFCGMLGLLIQTIIEVRRQKPCDHRC